MFSGRSDARNVFAVDIILIGDMREKLEKQVKEFKCLQEETGESKWR